MRPAPVGPVFSAEEAATLEVDIDADPYLAVDIDVDVDSAGRWLFSQTYYDTSGGEECEMQN